MAKLTARQIGLELDEHNKLEYELSGDEHDREYWEDYQSEQAYKGWDPTDYWDDEPFDDYDYGYDPYPMPFDDLFDGEW